MTDKRFTETVSTAKAESVGFNVEPSKDWDYDKSSYEFWKKELEE